MQSRASQRRKSPLLSRIFLYMILIGGSIIGIFFSAWMVLHGDVGFNTDIARDFLLLEDIVVSQKPTLIGARTGGIQGLFHGPLWLYLNLPAFIIGGGNPVSVGWFWVILTGIFVFISFYVGKKIFNTNVGLLAALLVSFLSIPYTYSLYNPFGAVLLFPLFFYFFWKYITEGNFVNSAIAFFIVGCIIQFQIAFGAPIFLLAVGYFFYKIYKTKKYSHMLALCAIIPPLSSYILFDIRHDFLQTRGVLDHMSGKNSTYITFSLFLQNRIESIVYASAFFPAAWYILLLFIGTFYGLFWKYMPKRNSMYILYFYFFIGYWVLSLFFKGYVWSYYYWPFLGITVIMFASTAVFLPKKIFLAFYTVVLISIFINTYHTIIYFNTTSGKGSSSWLFNTRLAKTIFAQGDKTFGYYIFSTDRYGYSPRYAMNYYQKKFINSKSIPYQKMPVTYLIIAPPGGKEFYLDGQWWKYNLVKMPKTPKKTWRFANNYTIDKYILSKEELAIPADQNLIDSIEFR